MANDHESDNPGRELVSRVIDEYSSAPESQKLRVLRKALEDEPFRKSLVQESYSAQPSPIAVLMSSRAGCAALWQSGDPEIQSELSSFIGMLTDPSDRDWLTGLAATADDELLRAAAAEAIGEGSAPSTFEVQCLHSLSEDEDSVVRGTAVGSAGVHGLRELLSACIEKEWRPWVRARALGAIASWGDSEAQEELWKATRHEHYLTRYHALNGLASVPGVATNPRFRHLLSTLARTDPARAVAARAKTVAAELSLELEDGET